MLVMNGSFLCSQAMSWLENSRSDNVIYAGDFNFTSKDPAVRLAEGWCALKVCTLCILCALKGLTLICEKGGAFCVYWP